MFFTRVMVSLFEFGLSVAMLAVGIYMVYRVIIKANPDFDMELEIAKGNVAVGILVGAILIATSSILQKVSFSVVSMFRLFLTAPPEHGISFWQLPLIAAGHLVMAFALSMFTISFTLRTFGRLTTRMEEGKELAKGNVAVGVLLASVVLVAAMFVGEGVSSVSKALIPQPSIGKIQILK